MQSRMMNPALVVPEAMKAIGALIAAATRNGAVASKTLQLVHLRVSQINGCAFCVDTGWRHAREAGESDERLFAVAAWRDAPFFAAAERAALALSEAVTRLSDRADPVPDAIWEEAVRHYDERAMSSLLLWIATTNVFNRLNVPTRQPAGTPVSW